MDPTFVFNSEDHGKSLVDVLYKYLGEAKLCDVMLICDGGNVKAHQLILSANSEHFEQLFTNSNYPIPFIHLPNIALSDMKCLLSFMYKGTISLKMHNFTRFMETAQRLKVRGLLKTSIAPQIPTPPLDQASYFDGAANPDESASVIFENIAQDCSTEEVILSNAENARPEPDVQENIISNRSDDCNDTPGITPPPPKEAYFGGPQKASSSEQYNLNLKAWHNPHPIQGSGCQQQMFGHDYGGFVQITDRRASIAVVGQFSTARKLPTQNNQRKMSISQDRFSPYVASRMTTNENAITLRKPDVSQILGASIPPTKVQAKVHILQIFERLSDSCSRCKVCDEVVMSMNSHYVKHFPAFFCTLCPAIYKNERTLRNHYQNKHPRVME